MSAARESAKTRNQRSTYRCFLVRCRLAPGAANGADDSAGPAAGWRFTVQEAGTDAARRSFACLEDVEAYLEAELESSTKHSVTGGLP